eukprot:403861-Hanusia_phi.AAC.9
MLKATGLHTELIYCLSGQRSISAALNTFGIQAESQNVILVVIDDQGETFDTIAKLIDGKHGNLDALKDLCDVEKIKKLYKITAEELSHPSSCLVDSVVCRRLCNVKLIGGVTGDAYSSARFSIIHVLFCHTPVPIHG